MKNKRAPPTNKKQTSLVGKQANSELSLYKLNKHKAAPVKGAVNFINLLL